VTFANIGADNKIINAGEEAKKDRKLSRSSGDIGAVYRICFTGGPCAGKTTAMAEIAQDLETMDLKVL
jgi:hypothetical protein